jgi:hypothetical protein
MQVVVAVVTIHSHQIMVLVELVEMVVVDREE